MTLKRWIILAVTALLVLAGAGAAALGGFYLYQQRRLQRWYETGERAYEKGEWLRAKRFYQLYLSKHQDDVATLRKYADANLMLLEDRRASLTAAATAYNQILRFHPGDVEARDKLLDLYVKLRSWGDLEYAAKEYSDEGPGADGDPGNAEVRYLEALALDRMGNQADAVAAYTDLLGKTSRPEVYTSLAGLLREQQRGIEAEEIIERAQHDLEPGVELHLELAKYYRDAGEAGQALEQLDKAAEIDPEDPALFAAKALLASDRRDYGLVIQHLEKALQSGPLDVDSSLILAHAYQRTGEAEKAIELLDNIDPMVKADNPEIYLRLIELQLSADRFEDADLTTENYRKAYPDHDLMLDYIAARRMLAEGNSKDAALELELVVKQRPDFAPGQYYLAVAYHDLDQDLKARRVLESYLARSPQDEVAQALYDFIIERREGVEDLERLAGDALSSDAADAASLNDLALRLFAACQREGRMAENKDSVVALYQRAIALAPEDATAYVRLAQTHNELGDAESARRVCQQGIAAGVNDTEFAMTQADIALAAGDAAAAKAFWAEAWEKGSLENSTVLRWSGLFVQRGEPRLAMSVLDDAIAEAEGDDLLTLEIERMRIGASQPDWDLNLAQKSVQELAAELAGNQRLLRLLNEVRLMLARRLRLEGGTENQKQADALVQVVRESGLNEGAVELWEAQHLLQKEPPDLEQAQAHLENVLNNIDPDNVGALLTMSQVLMRKEEPDLAGAVRYAERAVDAAPQPEPALMQLAKLQLQGGSYTQSAETLRRAFAINPDNTTAAQMLVEAYIGAGNFTEAETLLEQLELIAKDNPAEHNILQDLRSRIPTESSLAESVARAQSQYEANPDNFSAVQNLVRALVSRGQSTEAEDLLRDYVQGHEDQADGWEALGAFYLARFNNGGRQSDLDLEQALDAFQRALVIEPDSPDVWRNMIEVQWRRGRFTDALALCQRYLDRRPNDAQIWGLQASLMLQDTEGADKALESVSKAIEEAGELPGFVVVRGLAHLARGDWEKALSDLEPIAVRQQPTQPWLDLALADSYIGLGRKEEAVSRLDAAEAKIDAGQGNEDDQRRLEVVRAKLSR